MTDDRRLMEGEEDAVLAAEHALGLLDAAERGLAEARMERDARFAADVQAWRERLAPLADEAPALAPPPGLWPRIEAALDARPAAANDNGAAVRLWRRLALGASGLAAASLAAVVLLLARPSEPAAQVASLNDPAGATVLTAAFDPATGALLVTPGPGLRAAGSVPHLWLVQPDGGVRLVGAVSADRAATHNLPPALSRQARAATALALSLEPSGRTPVDRPGGPTVASGAFTEL